MDNMQSFNLLKTLQKNATRDVCCRMDLKLFESENTNLFLIMPENVELYRSVHLNTGILFLRIFSDASLYVVFRDTWNSKSSQSGSPILAIPSRRVKSAGNTLHEFNISGFQTMNLGWLT